MRAGKVRTIGSSTFPAADIVEAQWTAERRGRERFRTEQPPYSLFARGIERDVLPACERYGMGVLPWSPLNGSWLTGRYRKGQEVDLGSGRAARMPARFDPSDPGNQRKLDLVEQLVPVAEEAGCSLTHLAVAFVLEHPAVSSAIIGPRTMEQLQDLLPATEVRLSAEVLDRIDAIVPPGTDVTPTDTGYAPPSLAAGLAASPRRALVPCAARRRRPPRGPAPSSCVATGSGRRAP